MSRKLAALAILAILLPSILPAQVSLDLRLKNINALTLRPGDLNLTGLGSVPDVFELTLQNTSANPVQLRLRLEVMQQVQNQSRLIVNAMTNQFTLPADGMVYRATNQDLVRGWHVAGQDVEFIDKEFTQEFDDINQQFVETGKLPFGNYVFQVTALVTTPSGEVPVEDQDPSNNVIEVLNPSYVELIAPGASVSQSGILAIATLYPVFQWQTDPLPAELRQLLRFNLRVYEKAPWQRTVEDVINDVPVLHLENWNNTTFQYPADNQPITVPDPINPSRTMGTVGPIRLLKPGRVYYWLVEMLIPTATGVPDKIQSDVYRFQILDPQEASTNIQRLVVILRQLLGPNYEEVLRRLESEGYKPTGTVLINGRPVSLDRLNELLVQIQTGQLKISEVTLY